MTPPSIEADAPPATAAPLPVRLLGIGEVLKICSISKTTLYKLISEDSFPRGLKVGPKMVRWLDTDVERFIRNLARAS